MRAAQACGWTARNTLDPDDPEGWDLHIVVDSNTNVVVRLVGAAIPIDEPSTRAEQIANAWRVLALTAPPPGGAVGYHLVSVEPYLLRGNDCIAAKTALDTWLAVGPWSAGSGAKTWASVPAPLPRNSAGVIFPGLGLIARSATSGFWRAARAVTGQSPVCIADQTASSLQSSALGLRPPIDHLASVPMRPFSHAS